jgi:hypothetical protein
VPLQIRRKQDMDVQLSYRYDYHPPNLFHLNIYNLNYNLNYCEIKRIRCYEIKNIFSSTLYIFYWVR